MNEHARHLHFARDVANAILDSPQLRGIVRETVLILLAEQKYQHRAGVARVFFDACQRRGVRVRLGEDGRLKASGRLGADLMAVLTVYREEITAHLERLRDLETKERPTLPMRKATS